MSRGVLIVGVNRPTTIHEIEMMQAAERGLDRMQVVEFGAPKLNPLPPFMRAGGNYMHEENPLVRSVPPVAQGRLADWLFTESLPRPR